jgi:hypothetical protein
MQRSAAQSSSDADRGITELPIPAHRPIRHRSLPPKVVRPDLVGYADQEKNNVGRRDVNGAIIHWFEKGTLVLLASISGSFLLSSVLCGKPIAGLPF